MNHKFLVNLRYLLEKIPNFDKYFMNSIKTTCQIYFAAP